MCRKLKVEEFDVSFYKEIKETTLGLVVGGKALPYDQVIIVTVFTSDKHFTNRNDRV